MAELQSRQWGTLKFLFLCFSTLTGIWLGLHVLFKWFNLRLDVTFMLLFLLSHGILAGFVYFWFYVSLREKLSSQKINKLFKNAFIIACVGNGVMVTALLTLSYATSFALGDKLLLLSPLVFISLLFMAMHRGIPPAIRRDIKKSWKGSSVVPLSMDEEIIQPLDTNPDSFDPANPFGRMNPASPNYLYRADRWDK